MFVGQRNQLFQGFKRDQGACRIARRAQEQDLAALPRVGRDSVEIGVEAVFSQAWQVVRRGPGEKGRAFVDLVERVRADDQRVVATVDHGLSEGKQRFTGAVDREDVTRRVEPARRHVETALGPVGNGLTQGRDAQRGRVDRHLVEVVGQGFGHEIGGAVLGLANRQRNRAFVGIGLHAAQQGAQFFERVRLQLVQSVVHRVRISLGGA